MAKFCTECGAELREGIAFCTNCGAKAEQPAAAPQQMPEIHTAPAAEPRPAPRPAPEKAPPQTARPAAEPRTDKTVTTGTFFGLMFLFSLPVLGWLICLIMAFAPKNRNIKHFARAMLIWLVIALVLGLLIGLAVNALINSATVYIEQALAEAGIAEGLQGLQGLEGLGELSGVLEEFGALEDMMGQLEGMIPETGPVG